MKHTTLLTFSLLLLVSFAAAADELKDAFPLGVYWAWERNGANAAAAGTDRTNYVANALALCKAKNCDTVWIVNGPGKPDAPYFLDMCEKAGMKALINSSLMGYFVWGHDGDEAKVVQQLTKTAAAVGEKPALLGYILKDEPLHCSVQQIDYLHDLAKRIDPHHRDSTVVAMTPQIQTYLEDTSLPVLCMDIYHFGGNRSHLIPAPQRTSKGCYRATCQNAVTVAERRGKHVWIMPQSFCEIWGLTYYDDAGRQWCDPGTYIHWRMPTAAETRWQAWEAVRAGAKGVVFFLLNPNEERKEADVREGGKGYKNAQKSLKWFVSHDFMTDKRRIESEKTELPPETALTRCGGKSTPQFDALGEAFGRIAKAKDRLLKSRCAPFPVFFSADPDCATATFAIHRSTFNIQPSTSHLGVIVNDELNGAAREVVVSVPSNVESVREIGGGAYALSEAKDGLRTFALTLEPGDGRCVEATFKDGYAGMQLLHEDFLRHNYKGSVAAFAEARLCISYNVGGPKQLVYRENQAVTTNAPAFVVRNLTNPKTAINTAFMNINAKKRNGNVWLYAKGRSDGLRIRAVLDKDAKALETDTAHLEENAKAGEATTDAAPTMTLRPVPGLPVQLPVGTTGLEFYFDKKDASLVDVMLWFTP